jgi:hypothetical protein
MHVMSISICRLLITHHLPVKKTKMNIWYSSFNFVKYGDTQRSFAPHADKTENFPRFLSNRKSQGSRPHRELMDYRHRPGSM